MIEWMKRRAVQNFRSMNAELVEVIREAMQTENQKH